MIADCDDRQPANRRNARASTPYAANSCAIASPAASSPARPQNATRPPRRAIAHAAFAAIPPPTSR